MTSAVDKDMHPCKVRTFSNSVDEYGQKHTSYVEKTINAFYRKYRQSTTDSPLFVNVAYIVLTKELLDNNSNIEIDNKWYHIIYFIDSKSYKGNMTYRQLFVESA